MTEKKQKQMDQLEEQKKDVIDTVELLKSLTEGEKQMTIGFMLGIKFRTAAPECQKAV